VNTITLDERSRFSGSARAAASDIKAALSFIPSDDRDVWIRCGMAVKAELGEVGFDIWDEWSASSDKYRVGDASATWKSFKTTGEVGVGTLFHYAQQYGYRCDSTYKSTAPPTAEVAERKRIAAERVAKEEAEIARERAETARKAAAIWKATTEAKADHPYLERKRVSPVATLREIDVDVAAEILGYVPKSGGEQLTGRLLVVPVKQGGALSTLELIDGDKRKTALAGRGSKAGGYWATEPLPDTVNTLLIGEGVATVLSSREASGHPAIAALSSGNLQAVAKAMRERYPAAVLVILADLVKATGAPDPHAIEAAQVVGGKLAIPDFGATREPDATDFNDMAVTCGAEAVELAIANATYPARGEPQSDEENSAPERVSESREWPEPQPLTAKVEPEPYPLDALPDTMRAAVEEVADFVKAPWPLVVSSALSTLSLAIQAHFDAKRAEKLQGPVGLFLLTIADSGERKSTCDGFFTKPIRDYEEAQAEAAKPILKDHRAKVEAWEAKRSGIKDKIRQLAKESEATASMESALRDLENDKPEPPRIPRLLYADATPEALAYALAKQWPSGGVVSAEAGIVFGSHGMGKDSVMRNLALLNQLWDGTSLTIDRRSTESFTVRNARLTVALQVQEATLRSFLDKTGPLARGTGFLARFLVAWPESTQGNRPFTDPPDNWPHLTVFHDRITKILNQPVPIDEDGALTPALLTLAPEAKAAWVAFHDAIESDLSSGRELYEVRDVASKTADNAVRLAVLFQTFEHGMGGAVGLDCFERASRIIAWHLHEARRFYGELALPEELADAARLDSWLIEYCKRERTCLIPTREAQRLGPVRDKEELTIALRVLEELDRLRLTQEGRRKIIKVNPALVEIAS
jgi:putative DNA primase/helicase